MTLNDWLSEHGQRPLIKALGCSQSLISHYATGRKKVAPHQVVRIAEATGFVVTPHEIRPDIYPYADDAMPRTE